MARKKIFIDGLGVVEGHFSGVGQCILGVLRGIDQLLDEAKYRGEDVPEVVVIIPYDTAAKFKKYAFKHISYKRFPLSFRMMSALWHRGKLPPIDLWCGKGTYIFPRFVNMPLLFSKPSALVIFDLSYELYRQYSDEGNAIFLSKQVHRSLNTTKKVIAISENARQELIDFYKLKPADVVVATPATDPQSLYRRSPDEIERVKKKYGIEGNYILALSNLEPRKNLSALVEAYCRLPEKLRKNTSLLLVGVSGWKTESLFQDIVSRVQGGYNIIRPSSYVSDADKAAIISGAQMLVYPSHYEGFGMPPLEALACGVPVITADNSSLPEVVGDLCPMVKADDIDALTGTMIDMLNDIEGVSKKIRQEGPRRADKFSWKASGQVFLDVAEELSK
jgi:alpha-1,3-rhamnosyl/mannosyltransferase